MVRTESYSYDSVDPGDTPKVFDFRPRTTTIKLDNKTVAVTYASYATVGGSYVVVQEDRAILELLSFLYRWKIV